MAGATLTTAAFGGLGSILAFANIRDDHGNVQSPTTRGLGVGLLALGASIDIALIPAIFAPNKSERVFP